MDTMRRTLVGGGVVLATAFAERNRARAAASGPGTAAIPASRSTRRSIRSTGTTSRGCAIAWRRPAVDPSISARAPDFSYSNNFRATPLMVGGVLYSPNGIGLVEAFHPGTGKTLWVQEPFADEPDRACAATARAASRYWADGSERRLFVVRGEYLIALDPRDRASRSPTFGDSGPGQPASRVSGPRATGMSWTGVPQVCRDVVIVGVGHRRRRCAIGRRTRRRRPAIVQAFDVRTGKPRWTVQSDSAGRARSAARPGRTIRGRTAATRTCGR